MWANWQQAPSKDDDPKGWKPSFLRGGYLDLRGARLQEKRGDIEAVGAIWHSIEKVDMGLLFLWLWIQALLHSFGWRKYMAGETSCHKKAKKS